MHLSSCALLNTVYRALSDRKINVTVGMTKRYQIENSRRVYTASDVFLHDFYFSAESPYNDIGEYAFMMNQRMSPI